MNLVTNIHSKLLINRNAPMNRTSNMTTHWWREKIAILEAERLFKEGEVLVVVLTRRHASGWEGRIAWRQEAAVASRGRQHRSRLRSVNLFLPLLSLSHCCAFVKQKLDNEWDLICNQVIILNLISARLVCYNLPWKLVIVIF